MTRSEKPKRALSLTCPSAPLNQVVTDPPSKRLKSEHVPLSSMGHLHDAGADLHSSVELEGRLADANSRVAAGTTKATVDQSGMSNCIRISPLVSHLPKI